LVSEHINFATIGIRAQVDEGRYVEDRKSTAKFEVEKFNGKGTSAYGKRG